MNIQDYVVAAIAVFTYLVLLIIRPLLPEKFHKFLPLIAGVLGVFANIWLNNWQVTFAIFLEGLASGLSATGIDQLIKQTTGYYEKEEIKEPKPEITDGESS